MEDSLLIEIQRLCQLVHTRGLRELTVSRPEFSLSLTTVQAGSVAPARSHAGMPPAQRAVVEPEIAGHAITSPLIGTFYRSSSPDVPPFVEVGDQVETGQTIGIVEAMKVFNEIIADQAGTVIAIPANNGQLVQVDQPLVIFAV